MRIEFEFPGPPVPYVRMNSQNIWTERVQNYLAYKTVISLELATKFPHLVDHGPPTENKKERAAWLKKHKDTRYRLDYTVYEEREKGDFDNYGKLIGDALQASGLICNDKKIKTGSWSVEVDKQNPRIHLILESI